MYIEAAVQSNGSILALVTQKVLEMLLLRFEFSKAVLLGNNADYCKLMRGMVDHQSVDCGCDCT